MVVCDAGWARGSRQVPWHHRRVEPLEPVEDVTFAAAVLAGLEPEARELCQSRDLPAQLASGLAAARARWPEAPLPDARLAAYVAQRIGRQPELATVLSRLRMEDLFLAWWAGQGAPAGIRAFEAAYADDIERLVARFHRLPAVELRQRLRVKLFVAAPGAHPRIFGYAGFGFLQNWLRVTAARDFVDAARSESSARYESDLDEHELLGLSTPTDPRLEHVRAQLGGAVKRAFAAAVATLAPRQRTFLRHAYVDRLTLDQIASTYALHRATVARTLAGGREHLITATRCQVAVELGVPADDLASAIAALDMRLELSLSRVLKSELQPS